MKRTCSLDGELYTLYLSEHCPRRKGFGGILFDVAYDLIRKGFNWDLIMKSGISTKIIEQANTVGIIN